MDPAPVSGSFFSFFPPKLTPAVTVSVTLSSVQLRYDRYSWPGCCGNVTHNAPVSRRMNHEKLRPYSVSCGGGGSKPSVWVDL